MNDNSTNPILTRMRQPGPKKILACDGGGIRGLISVEILARLEAELRHHFAQPDLLLGDYFDFICGTSTGGNHRQLPFLRHGHGEDPQLLS